MPNGKLVFLITHNDTLVCESAEQRYEKNIKDFEETLGVHSFLQEEIRKVLTSLLNIRIFPKFYILRELRQVIYQKLKKKGKKKKAIRKISHELFNLLNSNEYVVEAFPSSLNHKSIRERFIVGHRFAGLFLFKLPNE
ncbi:MAG: hypothetical protein V3V33_16355 [Candidatus Lokiarchaeia archaeon]